MTVFAITEKDRLAIRGAVAWVRSHPVPIDVVMAGVDMKTQNTDTVKIEDRPPGWKRPEARQVVLPFGFRLAVSCEEQPAGHVLAPVAVVARADQDVTGAGSVPHGDRSHWPRHTKPTARTRMD